MERIEPAQLAQIILAAPAWARVGLTVRDVRLRERAAEALAVDLIEQFNAPVTVEDRDQLRLDLEG